MDKAKIKSAIKLAMDTQDCLIGNGCISQLPEILKKHFSGTRMVVVADDNTFKAAGSLVIDKLKSTGFDVISPFIFPGQPMLHADYPHVERLKEGLINDDAIAIAVGSGTINDIAKLASYQSNRKYMVVPTAASVDGYSAYGA
jgi:glycerol-1-phosphate dehydrogenase [NAD(P)+]